MVEAGVAQNQAQTADWGREHGGALLFQWRTRSLPLHSARVNSVTRPHLTTSLEECSPYLDNHTPRHDSVIMGEENGHYIAIISLSHDYNYMPNPVSPPSQSLNTGVALGTTTTYSHQ